MTPARISVNNPVLVNLVMIAIIVLGTLALIALPREVMPQMDMHWAFIIHPYPGISPEEMEKLITIPIEEEISDVEGVESITSSSADGRSMISVKFKEMSEEEFRLRYQDLRVEVDKVQDIPEDAMDMIMMSFNTSDLVPVIAVHLHGDLPPKRLMELGKELRKELLDITLIGKVQLAGVRDREIWVEADPVKLEGQSISLQQIQNAIAMHGLNIPGGSIDVGRQEIFVRTVGEFDSADDVKKVIVRSTPTGQTVRVGDVANIREDFADERTRSYLNKEPAVTLTITKQVSGNAIHVTDEVKRISEEFVKRHGDKLHATFTKDSSEPINDILNGLTRNAWIGFATVVIMLLVVLGFRNAILAALGIPLSFMACFILMFNMGDSFNGNSLFALVLVLGIVVDDAIIIVENCYRHRQMGKSWKQAAIEGTEEVTGPVFAAIATTIAVFLPLMLLPGIMGKFMRIIPIVVSLALAASLFEALFILPSHFADWPGRGDRKPRPTPRWLISLQEAYAVGLRRVVRFRWIGIALVVIVFFGSCSVIPLLGVNMFAGEEIPTFQVRVTMPKGTRLEETSRVLAEFERRALELPKTELRSVHSTAGLIMTDEDWVFKSNLGELWLDLVPPKERERSLDKIMEDLRERVLKISGPTGIELAKLNNGPPVGKPVEVKVKGKYLDQLELLAEELKSSLEKMDGVLDVGDDFEEGRGEVRFRVDPDRAALHRLSVAQVGMALRQAVSGVTADRLYDGDEELDIVVRLDMNAVERPEDLLRLPIRTPAGAMIALGDVADYRIEKALGQINRYKGQRAITVFAGEIDEEKTSLLDVKNAISAKFDQVKGRYPGLTLDFSGEFQEFKEAFAGIVQLGLFGVLLVFVILGTQLRSYAQPLVILCTIPMAFIGAIFGLVVSGNPFSLVTIYGIVALFGVAVNDAIVLVSFINNTRKEGMDIKEAVVQAGQYRLRPIILTSLTTIAGLLPMALGIGGVSLSWSPMANTIAWGLAVGTMMTLFMIPAIYVFVIDDIPRLFRWLGGLMKRAIFVDA